MEWLMGMAHGTPMESPMESPIKSPKRRKSPSEHVRSRVVTLVKRVLLYHNTDYFVIYRALNFLIGRRRCYGHYIYVSVVGVNEAPLVDCRNWNWE